MRLAFREQIATLSEFKLNRLSLICLTRVKKYAKQAYQTSAAAGDLGREDNQLAQKLQITSLDQEAPQLANQRNKREQNPLKVGAPFRAHVNLKLLIPTRPRDQLNGMPE